MAIIITGKEKKFTSRQTNKLFQDTNLVNFNRRQTNKLFQDKIINITTKA